MKNNSTDQEKLKEIEEKLGVAFENKDLLIKAFTHRSYLNEHKSADAHNERLEYLGDAVLELLVSQELFFSYPDRQEGELTSFRSAIVKTETLAEAARELDYGSFLRMSRGEQNTGGRDKDYLLANTFEAVIGAMYLDQGIEVCKEFLERVLFPKIKVVVKNRLDIDPKTQFQEIAQELHRLTPTYELISEHGPDHEKEFVMGAYLGEKEYGRGKGASKQRAEEAAAQKGLSKIRQEAPTVQEEEVKKPESA